MKIFVTGCAGLLGANYTRHLISDGAGVVILSEKNEVIEEMEEKGLIEEFK
jgi:nucleoside-diphosphate-sugar epimerase